MKVWVLVIDHKHGLTVTAHANEQQAQKALWDWCNEWWEHELGSLPRPANQADDLVDEYFELVEYETAHIEECEVGA